VLVVGPLPVQDDGQAAVADHPEEGQGQPDHQGPHPGTPRHPPDLHPDALQPRQIAVLRRTHAGEEAADDLRAVLGIDQGVLREVLHQIALTQARVDAVPVVRHDHDVRQVLHQVAPGHTAGRAGEHKDDGQFRTREGPAPATPEEQDVDRGHKEDQRTDDHHRQQMPAGEALQVQDPVVDIAETGDEQGAEDADSEGTQGHGLAFP